MNFIDVVNRKPPQPWIDGEKIPWNEPGFSQRMLAEHLSQAHNAASRRFAIIDEHVAWIHHHVLGDRPARILDLGCGPGLYLNRLAQLGHRGTGYRLLACLDRLRTRHCRRRPAWPFSTGWTTCARQSLPSR